MFWGITLENGKRYTQVVKTSFHVSMACLEPMLQARGSGDSKSFVSVMFEHEKSEFLLCTLQHGMLLQQPLDLNFIEGETITFFLNGEGIVHLTGYIVEGEDDDMSDVLHSDEEFNQGLKRKIINDMVVGNKKSKPSSESDSEDEVGDVQYDSDMGEDSDEDDESDDGDEDDENSDHSDSDGELMVTTPAAKRLNTMKTPPNAKVPKLVHTPHPAKAQKTPTQQKAGNKTPGQQNATPKKTPQLKAAQQTPGQQNASPKKSGQQNAVPKTPGQQNAAPKTPGQQNTTPKTPVGKQEKKPEAVNGTPLDSSLAGSKKKRNRKKNKNLNNTNSSCDETPVKKSVQTPKATPGKETQSPKKLPGGIVINDLSLGSGPEAKPGKHVHVYYVGKLQNNKEFDSVQKGKPFKFRLGSGEVIKGWDAGIQGMKVGGKRKLVIPSQQAYGSKAVGPIPPNSTLSFEVNLVAVS